MNKHTILFFIAIVFFFLISTWSQKIQASAFINSQRKTILDQLPPPPPLDEEREMIMQVYAEYDSRKEDGYKKFAQRLQRIFASGETFAHYEGQRSSIYFVISACDDFIEQHKVVHKYILEIQKAAHEYLTLLNKISKRKRQKWKEMCCLTNIGSKIYILFATCTCVEFKEDLRKRFTSFVKVSGWHEEGLKPLQKMTIHRRGFHETILNYEKRKKRFYHLEHTKRKRRLAFAHLNNLVRYIHEATIKGRRDDYYTEYLQKLTKEFFSTPKNRKLRVQKALQILEAWLFQPPDFDLHILK